MLTSAKTLNNFSDESVFKIGGEMLKCTRL